MTRIARLPVSTVIYRACMTVFPLAFSPLVATPDYFPVETGNAWTFSYTSTTAPVVLHPSTTRDSGTVKWEIYSNAQTEETLAIGIKRTRSLVRRTVTPTDCTSVKYDSVFTPSRIASDTITLAQAYAGANYICFAGDTCPFAAHDPAIEIPDRSPLTFKDTAVFFRNAPVAGIKMLVSGCSCLQAHPWESKPSSLLSFTLGPAVGPVGASITWCPSVGGSSYKETWELVGRDYPAVVLTGNARPAALQAAVPRHFPGRITWAFALDHSSPVRIELLDVNGRLLRTLLRGNLDAGVHRFSWNVPTNPLGLALLRVRTGAANQCTRFITDAQ